MASTIKGLTIEIDGNTSKLSKALDEVSKDSKNISSELSQVNKLLKFSPNDTVLLEQKQQLLAKSVENTKTKLKILEDAQESVNQQFKNGDIGEEQYRAFQREIVKTKSQLETFEGQLNNTQADLAHFATGADKTADELVDLANKADKAGDNLDEALSKDDAIGNLKKIGTAAAVAGAAVAAAFVGMANAALENADELQRQADVTGLSAERLQELAYIGNNLGVELDTITGAQAKLTKSMDAAKDGTGAQAEAFKSLGISVLDSNGNLRDSKDVMTEAFNALNSVGNETERDALAMQLFGKSAMEMNPLIKAGGDELNKLAQEARDSGAVMSNEAVAGLDTFGDTIDNIKNGVLGAFGEKFAEVLPYIQEMLDKLQDLPQWIEENSTLLEILGVVIGTITALVIAFNIQQALAASGLTLWSFIAGVATGITTALGAAFTFLTSPIGLVILAIGAVIAIGILLYKNWDTIKAKASELWGKLKATFSGIKDSVVNKWNEVISGIKNVWNNIVSFFKELPGKMLGFGKDIIDGLVNGIKSKITAVTNAIKDVTSKITGKVKSILGIASPSKVMFEMGEWTGEGLALGIEDTVGRVQKATQNLASRVTDTMGNTKLGNNTIVNNNNQTVENVITLDGREIARGTVGYTATELNKYSNRKLGGRGVAYAR